jgi:tetratricopeptide (TPR) repeat protein
MSNDELRRLFAHAYQKAALDGANMRRAVEALESIREAVEEPRQSFLDVLAAMDEQIGQVDLGRLAPALCELRTSYSSMAVAEEAQRLRSKFDEDAVAGWQAWLNAYVKIFQLSGWSTRIGFTLARDGLVSSPIPEWPVERVRRVAWLAWHDRWPEVYDWFIFLAAQEIPAASRARMLAIAAEIQMYRFGHFTKATRLLDEAERAASSDHLALRVRAELCFEKDAVEQAKQRYQELVERWPRLPDGYVGLAECADKEKDPAAAEALYQQAVQIAPGMVYSHRNLMSWYARRIDEFDTLVLPIFERVSMLADEASPEHVELGLLYKKARRFERAREHLRKAIELQPDNGSAEIWLGRVDLEDDKGEEAERLASAERHFTRDIEICPESLDGCWGMVDVSARREDWSAAKKWCDQGLKSHTEWEDFVLARRAEIQFELGDREAAWEDVHQSLRQEPRNQSALRVLWEVAEKARAPGDDVEAERWLTEWRSQKGEAGEKSYQNRLGNWRYEAGDYEAAEKHYRKAIEGDAKDPVLHSNHALAAEQLRSQGARQRWLDEAVSDLTRALALNPGELEYRERLASLVAERYFIETYGEGALTLLPGVIPIRVELPDNMLPAILNDDLTELSAETRSRVNDWKESFRARLGVPLPGVNFRESGDLAAPDAIRISIMERGEYVRTIKRSSLLEDLFSHLDAACRERVVEFVGHEETALLLHSDGGPEASRIVDTTGALTPFVCFLRGLLSRGESIAEIGAIAAEYLARPNSVASCQTAPQVARAEERGT